MAEWTFDPENISRNIDWPTRVSTFENESEQRRQIVKKKIVTWNYKSTNLTESQYRARLAFFNAREGAKESFTYEDDSDGLTYTVRFVPRSWRDEFKGGTWKLSFGMKALNQGA